MSRVDQMLLGVKALARRVGVEVHRFEPATSFDAQRARLLELHGVDLVVDVGANEGQWTKRVRASGYRGQVVSFEPFSSAFSALSAAAVRDPQWDARRVALDETAGEAELHVAANSASSSLLDMAPLHEQVAPDSGYVASEQVEVARLDATPLPDARSILLKADVQGAELGVVRGAAGLLDRVPLLELEVSLEGLYVGAPLARDVFNELDGLGYAVAGVAPTLVDPASARLLQLDALFVKASA